MKKSTQDMQRRSFLGLLAAGGGVGWTYKGLLEKVMQRLRPGLSSERVTVTPHPLAVPRTRQESHENG